MNEEFEKWFNNSGSKFPPFEYRDKGLARESWEACKQEVLKILNKHTQPIFDTELRKEDWEKVINIDAIKEIEKL